MTVNRVFEIMEERGVFPKEEHFSDKDKYEKKMADVLRWAMRLTHTSNTYDYIFNTHKDWEDKENHHFIIVENLLNNEGIRLRKKLQIYIPDPEEV